MSFLNSEISGLSARGLALDGNPHRPGSQSAHRIDPPHVRPALGFLANSVVELRNPAIELLAKCSDSCVCPQVCTTDAAGFRSALTFEFASFDARTQILSRANPRCKCGPTIAEDHRPSPDHSKALVGRRFAGFRVARGNSVTDGK